jgi:alkanesulfonate monooxygenase SsuD/methylene tetrahydromethanopterin reductase-like flavin-dependent oxidoreductase (luciferase family)
VGIGGDWFGDYSAFGEPDDDKSHGEMLDEGLDVLAGLWSGEPFSYSGSHFKVSEVHFLPRPVQQPRIPIWVAGRWPNKKPFRRAAQWDGVVPLAAEEQELTPDEIRSLLAYTREHRAQDAPFDVVHAGRTRGDDPAADRAQVLPYAEAGATWWLENFNREDSAETVRERIRKGPPRL